MLDTTHSLEHFTSMTPSGPSLRFTLEQTTGRDLDFIRCRLAGLGVSTTQLRKVCECASHLWAAAQDFGSRHSYAHCLPKWTSYRYKWVDHCSCPRLLYLANLYDFALPLRRRCPICCIHLLHSLPLFECRHCWYSTWLGAPTWTLTIGPWIRSYELLVKFASSIQFHGYVQGVIYFNSQHFTEQTQFVIGTMTESSRGVQL